MRITDIKIESILVILLIISFILYELETISLNNFVSFLMLIVFTVLFYFLMKGNGGKPIPTASTIS